MLLIEIYVAGHLFDALLVRNCQDLFWIEMAMKLLELGGQFVAVLAFSLKFQFFLKQRCLELSLFPSFLCMQIIDSLR